MIVRAIFTHAASLATGHVRGEPSHVLTAWRVKARLLRGCEALFAESSASPILGCAGYAGHDYLRNFGVIMTETIQHTPSTSARSRRGHRGAALVVPEPVASLSASFTYKPWDADDATDHKCAKYTENVPVVKSGGNRHDLFAKAGPQPKSKQVLSGKALYPMNDALIEEFLARGVTTMPQRAVITIEFFAE